MLNKKLLKIKIQISLVSCFCDVQIFGILYNWSHKWTIKLQPTCLHLRTNLFWIYLFCKCDKLFGIFLKRNETFQKEWAQHSPKWNVFVKVPMKQNFFFSLFAIFIILKALPNKIIKKICFIGTLKLNKIMIFKIVNFLEINNNNYLLYNRLLSSSSWRRKKGGVGCGHPSEVLQCMLQNNLLYPLQFPPV